MSEKIYNMVDIETVSKLADLVSEKELSEITIADGEKSITIKGKKCPPPPHHGHDCPPPPPPYSALAMPNEAPERTSAEVSESKPASTGKFIKAPIVGTFYAAPAPDQKPFVKVFVNIKFITVDFQMAFVQVGDTIKKGDVFLIIESMKLMNEVTSDVEGVVEEIFVKNGEAVEYDQPLMRLS